MPQEFRVLQCFNCETFQVDIIKKSPKWVCKMCGEKQSVIKVYGTGTARECRIFVQETNMKRANQPLKQLENHLVDDNNDNIELENLDNNCSTSEVDNQINDYNMIERKNMDHNTNRKSKWLEFISEESKPNDTKNNSKRKSDALDCSEESEKSVIESEENNKYITKKKFCSEIRIENETESKIEIENNFSDCESKSEIDVFEEINDNSSYVLQNKSNDKIKTSNIFEHEGNLDLALDF